MCLAPAYSPWMSAPTKGVSRDKLVCFPPAMACAFKHTAINDMVLLYADTDKRRAHRLCTCMLSKLCLHGVSLSTTIYHNLAHYFVSSTDIQRKAPSDAVAMNTYLPCYSTCLAKNLFCMESILHCMHDPHLLHMPVDRLQLVC